MSLAAAWKLPFFAHGTIMTPPKHHMKIFNDELSLWEAVKNSAGSPTMQDGELEVPPRDTKFLDQIRHREGDWLKDWLLYRVNDDYFLHCRILNELGKILHCVFLQKKLHLLTLEFLLVTKLRKNSQNEGLLHFFHQSAEKGRGSKDTTCDLSLASGASDSPLMVGWVQVAGIDLQPWNINVAEIDMWICWDCGCLFLSWPLSCS